MGLSRFIGSPYVFELFLNRIQEDDPRPVSMTLEVNRLVNLYPKAVALTIAGSDCSGGAGLQADLKTFQQLGVYGMSAITLVTVQNTVGVQSIFSLDPKLVIAQIDACISDIPPTAAKIGALGTAAMVDEIADRASSFEFPLVVDPVIVSKHGNLLLDEDAIELIRTKLLKNAFLVTPNRFEAEKLVGMQLDNPDMVAKAIHDLHLLGAENVLLKLGEVDGDSIHILGNKEQNIAISVPRLKTKNTHGTGCALSAAITAKLARGDSLTDACNFAVGAIWQAINAGHPHGSGFHPIEFALIAAEDRINKAILK